MYLPEEKRAEIRNCIENQRSCSGENRKDRINWPHDTEDIRKVSQILFEARDGKEVFTPF